MKNIKKLMTICIALMLFGVVSVNAETKYVNGKKYNFSGTFSYSGDFDGVIEKDSKLYAFDEDKSDGKLQEISLGDTVSLSETEYKYSIVNDWFNTNDGIAQCTKVSLRDNDVTSKIDVMCSSPLLNLQNVSTDVVIMSIEPQHELGVNYGVYFAGELAIEYGPNEYDIYNSDGSYSGTLKFDDIVDGEKSLDIDLNTAKSSYDYTILSYFDYTSNKMLFIVNLYDEYNKKSEVLVFDTKANKLMDIVEDGAIDATESYPIDIYYKDSKYYALYINDNDGKVIRTDGNNKEIITTVTDGNVYFYDGFIVVNAYVNDSDKGYLYDVNLNLVYQNDNGRIFIIRVINSLEDLKTATYFPIEDINKIKVNLNNRYVTPSNTKYVVSFESYESEKYTYSYKIMSIDDVKKNSISGYLKDKNGKALKDYTVELHSTVRTVKTDSNGYFRFDDVEEGEHTLTIKDTNDNVVATKTINVVSGSETKLDGDTLYFNESDNGLNLNLSLDGDKLTIVSVDKGVKEKESILVPKTFDGIVRNILIVSLLTGLVIYLVRKNNKIKVADIK